MRIDYLVRVEHFIDDLKLLLENVELDTEGLNWNDWMNASGDHPLEEDAFFRPQDLEFIGTHWESDLRLGKYELDPDIRIEAGHTVEVTS